MKMNTVEDLAYGRLPIVITSMPASTRERRLAFGIIIFLLVVFLIIAPFASVPLPRVDAFIPVIQTVLCVADLTTSALLFAQYSVEPMRGVLALACGYMFSGLFAFLQTFAFPGAYAPAGLFGDLSTAAYLFCLWHIAFPLAVIVYALSKDTGKGANVSDSSTAVVVRIAIACVVAITAGLTWAVSAGAQYLPSLFVNTTTQTPFTNYLLGSIWLLSAVALVLLFARKRSVLAVWLAVTVFVTLPDLTLSTVMTTVRFTLGWYVARNYALLASCIVLIALLTETTVLYARLANAILLLRRERANRLMNMQAATAAMAHELRQPLSAIVSYGGAGLKWLERSPPNLEEVRACLNSTVRASHRAEETIAGIRELFNQKPGQRTMIQVNDIACEVLRLMEHDLQVGDISVTTEFKENLPQIHANGTQIQEVILNLIKNAVEAMDSVPPGKRRLQLAAKLDKSKSVILLSIEDSGSGIAVQDRERIFDPFFTTKISGTGLGLSLCRVMVEDHGGRLRLSKTDSSGSIFEIALPIGK
jgi:signal transduction histidine kinase